MDAASRPPPFRPTATALRYGGFAGAVVLALAAARSGQRPIAIPAWLLGTGLLTGAWLLLGRRLSGVRLSWVLVTAALWALPLLCSLPLESRDVYAYACQGTLVTHGIDPYTHGAASLPCPWLSEVPRLWRHTPSPYGPLWLAVAGGAAATHGLVAAVAVFRLVALAGMVLTGWAGHRLARAIGTDPVRAAWFVLASPLVLVHGLAGAHNDALLTGLLVAAFAVAVTGAPGVGRILAVGALIGLATAVKATALVALPFAVLLVAADRRWRTLLRDGALALLGLAGGYAVLWGLTGHGLGWLGALSDTTRLIVESTSIPTALGLAVAHAIKLAGHPDAARQALTVVRGLGVVVLVLVLIVLWLSARRQTDRGRVVLIAGVALIAAVLLAPVVFPWYLLAGVAVLGYAPLPERWRWRAALLTAPVGLLILPNGNGLAAVFRGPIAVLDVVLLVAAVAVGARRLARRRQVAAAGSRR